MANVLELTCLMLLLVLVTVTGNNLVSDGKIHFSVVPDQVQSFALQTKPLTHVQYLFTSYELIIESSAPDAILVKYSNEPFPSSIKDPRFESNSRFINCERADIVHPEFNNTCIVRLSVFGELTDWWNLRFFDWQYYTNPPLIYVAVYMPERGYKIFSSGSGGLFAVTITEQTAVQERLIQLLIGLTIFIVAPRLSRSFNYFLVICFFGGALFFLSLIGIVVMLFFSRQIRSNITIAGIIPMIMSLGASVVAFSHFGPGFIFDLLSNKPFTIFLTVGGLVGLWFGFSLRFSPILQAKLCFFTRLLSLVIVFFCFSQPEAALIICATLALTTQMQANRYLTSLFNPRRVSHHKSTPRSVQSVNRTRYYISEADFAKEGRVYTNKAIKKLAATVKENPSELLKLSATARDRVLRLIDDPVLTASYGQN